MIVGEERFWEWAEVEVIVDDERNDMMCLFG